MLSRVVLSLLTLVLFSACGSSSGGGDSKPMTPLTPEQKGKVQNVTESMNAAQGAASQGRNTGPNLNPNMRIALSTTAGPSEKTRRLGQKLQEGRCEFENTLPQDGTTPQNGEFSLKVGGPGCPIHMMTSQKYSTKQTSNSFDMQADFAISYGVNSPDFAQLNDVTSIEFKGTTKGHGDANGGNVGGRFDGFLQSQQYGKLPMYMTMDMSGNDKGSTSTMTLGMTFPDFAAVGKVVAKSDGRVTETSYYVNDQKVTEAEFQNTFNEASNAKP